MSIDICWVFVTEKNKINRWIKTKRLPHKPSFTEVEARYCVTFYLLFLSFLRLTKLKVLVRPYTITNNLLFILVSLLSPLPILSLFSLPSNHYSHPLPHPCRRPSSPWCPWRWRRCGRRWWSFRTFWARRLLACWWGALSTPRSLTRCSSPSTTRCVREEGGSEGNYSRDGDKEGKLEQRWRK